MSWGPFMRAMVDVSTSDWKRIIMKMTWAYRRGDEFSPTEIKDWFNVMPPKEEWEAVRKEITRRRSASHRNDGTISPRREAARRRRREYMKHYMRKYREAQRTELAKRRGANIDGGIDTENVMSG